MPSRQDYQATCLMLPVMVHYIIIRGVLRSRGGALLPWSASGIAKTVAAAARNQVYLARSKTATRRDHDRNCKEAVVKNNTATFESLQRFQRGPGWRWALAQRGAAGNLPGMFLAADELLKKAADYIDLLAQGDGEAFLAARRYPQVHAAVALWNNPPLQTRLKILTLGDCPRAEIAGRLGLDLETIKTAEDLFFDVRAQLQARDWIVSAAILPEQRDGNTDLATHLRVAYFGGPLVAQMIVDAPQRLPVVEADRLYDQSLLLHAKAQQALAVPLRDVKSALKFIELLMDYNCRTGTLELAREKFRHRCELEPRRQQQADQPTENTTEEPITPAAILKSA